MSVAAAAVNAQSALPSPLSSHSFQEHLNVEGVGTSLVVGRKILDARSW